MNGVESIEQMPLRRETAEAAAAWLLRLDASEADRAAWQAWCTQDADHLRAWRRLEALGLRLRALPPEVALAALDRPQSDSRRQLLLALLTVGTIAAVGTREPAWRAWLADARTTVGERRSLSLPDGSQVELNTATAIDLEFGDTLRRVRLIEGEILIETAADAARRPFVVDTDHGRILALGTRFTVRRLDAAVLATVHEHAIEVQVSGLAPQRIEAGQSLRFDRRRIDDPTAADPNAQAWTRGLLYADRMPIETVARELSRYRRGFLRCDPEIAGLRVSGALPLDRTDEALALLARTLPIRVQTRSGWWVTLAAR